MASSGRVPSLAEIEAQVANIVAFETAEGRGIEDPLTALAELAARALASERALAARVDELAGDGRLRYESATGIEEGGRTGLTAVTVAALFLAALVLTPVFVAVRALLDLRPVTRCDHWAAPLDDVGIIRAMIPPAVGSRWCRSADLGA